MELRKLELAKVLQKDAEEIFAAREKALLIHASRDIDAAGDEVEMAVRKVIRRKLASKYYVGHGHILDAELTTSPQLDVVLADNSGAPILFRAENGTEYFPYESVYAIGEVKSSYYNNKKYVHTFCDTLKRIKANLKREATPLSYVSPDFNLGSVFRVTGKKPYRNPLFSFMLFVRSNDFHPDQLKELYSTLPQSELPNVICLLDKGMVINMHYRLDAAGHESFSLNIIPEFNKAMGTEPSRWLFLPMGTADERMGAHLGHLIFMLSEHLKYCALMPPKLFTYFNRFFKSSEGGALIT
ncbi:MAG TPA: DUF6602 domain-containing protein [Pyrinomonadaceae bacterium]|nr:DUF6602 domain-containing protein [Pyrinomonadaceae bacterium]